MLSVVVPRFGFGGFSLAACPCSRVRPSPCQCGSVCWFVCGGGAPCCARSFSVAHPPDCAVLLCRLWRRGAPFFVPSQSRESQVSAFAPCERREVYGLPKHCFELNAPLCGARFPVLECPSLFAPLALSRCVRLARRVFSRLSRSVQRVRPQHHPKINYLNLRRLSRSRR